jgi:hypothetical protein
MLCRPATRPGTKAFLSVTPVAPRRSLFLPNAEIISG